MTAAKAPAWRNRIVGHADVAPDQLLANPGNWRIHPGAQRSALRGSLDELGWVQSVIVNQQTGHVVDGHARVEEALSKGAPTVPVVYVDLSPDEERLALAIIDPIAAMAGTDRERLEELLADVRVDDAALAALLVDLGGPESRKPGLVDPDDAPALRDPDVAAGDLWELGEHRLLCGDATDPAAVAELLGEDPVDLVWTDPPYGVVYEGGTEARLRLANDELTGDPLRALVAGALRLSRLRPGGTFYLCSPSGPNLLPFLLALEDAGWPHRQTIVWVKDRFVLGHSDFHYRHEPMLAGELPGTPPPRTIDLSGRRRRQGRRPDRLRLGAGRAPSVQRRSARRLGVGDRAPRRVA